MRRVFELLGRFVSGHAVLVAIVIVLLMVLGIAGAGRIEMASGISTMVDTDGDAYQRFLKLDEKFGSSQVVLLISADSIDPIIEPGNLQALDRVAEGLAGDSRIVSIVNPVDGLRQALDKRDGQPSIDDTAAVRDVLLDPETGDVRQSFSPLFPEGRNALFVVTLPSDLDQSEQIQISDATESAATAAGFSEVETLTTGFPAVSSALEKALTSSLRTTLLVALVLMLIVLAILFPVRSRFYWRWLSLGSVFFGIIYAFGVMGWVGQSLSIGSLTVFPIIIGLGVDYAIQFHNRYDEEIRRYGSVREALILTMRHIGSATGLAVIAAMLGAVALLTSSTPIIQDFALTLLFGVVAAWVGAFLVVPLALYWHYSRQRRSVPPILQGTPPNAQAADSDSAVSRRLQSTGLWVVRHPVFVLPVALLLAIGGFLVDDQIGLKTNQEDFLSARLPAVKGLLKLQSVSGGSTNLNLVVEAETVADPEVVRWVDALQPRLTGQFPDTVNKVTSYADAVRRSNEGELLSTEEEVRDVLSELPEANRKALVTDDFTATNVSLVLSEVPLGELEPVIEAIEEQVSDPPAGVTVTVSGFPLIITEVVDALTSGRLRVTALSIAIILGGMLLLHRFNLMRALFITIPMTFIVGWSSGLMWVAGIDFNPLTATIGALIVGIGAEFGILVLSRYYEAIERGIPPEDAMVEAIMRIGRAVIASGITAMAGFGALLSARDFPILQDFGVVTVIAMGFSIISALVVMPALVVPIHSWWLRKRVGILTLGRAAYRGRTSASVIGDDVGDS